LLCEVNRVHTYLLSANENGGASSGGIVSPATFGMAIGTCPSSGIVCGVIDSQASPNSTAATPVALATGSMGGAAAADVAYTTARHIGGSNFLLGDGQSDCNGGGAGSIAERASNAGTGANQYPITVQSCLYIKS